ncbi:MAG: fimbrillin family protein [Alistipes sp.]|nr:fimbrillin family protein [Alistipes sp.]
MKTSVKNAVLSMVGISAVLLAGCSKNESEVTPPVDGSSVEMVLYGGVSATGSIAAATRAVIDSSYGSDLEVAFARIDQDAAGNYPADYSAVAALPATWKVNATSSKLPAADADASAIVFDTKQYYLSRAENNSSKLVGWYPEKALTDGAVSFTIDGQTDVMLTEVLEANKKEVFGINAADATKNKIFHFKHQLALLKVLAYAEDAAAAEVWGKVKSITLKEQLPTCKITLPATVAFEGTAADLALVKKQVADDADITYDLQLGIADAPAESTDPDAGDDETAGGGETDPAEPAEPAEPKTNAVECGYAMVAPIKSDAKLTLVVETEKGGAQEISVPVPATGFKEGYSYDITLKFTAVLVAPVATVTDWVSYEGNGKDDLVITL